LGIFLGALLTVPVFGVYGLTVSVVFGALLFMVVQISNTETIYFLKNFRFTFAVRDWVLFVRENLGRFVAVLSYQLYGVAILSIASLSGAGGVSAFSIAYNLYLAAFFVLGASFSTVLMPRISESHVKGENELQKKNLRLSIFAIFTLSLFVALILFFTSFFIVKVLYYFSNLAEYTALYIASLLSILSISFPLFNVLEVTRKYFYSTEQIFMAGVQTVFLLLGVGVCTYLISIFSVFSILISLVFGINISMFFTTVFTLLILKYKKQI
jgi:peptidoglycan biosynthesis protein MviN/MurJ (putative lipid II flippase)